jgi:hypothetical protein
MERRPIGTRARAADLIATEFCGGVRIYFEHVLQGVSIFESRTFAHNFSYRFPVLFLMEMLVV